MIFTWARCKGLIGAALLSAAVPAGFSGTAGAQTLTTIHSFCAKTNCPDGDGSFADTPLVRDASGNFYGMTPDGGSNKTLGGNVFQLSFDSAKGAWQFKTIYDFPKVKHGIDPHGPLIIDTEGDLYLVTSQGGLGGGQNGAVVELRPNADLTKWKQHTLYAFCPEETSCPDGAGPLSSGLTYAGQAAGLPYDGQSPLYGTTILGGANNKGVVFALSLSNTTRKWSEKVLYNFCSVTNCLDGYEPRYGVSMDVNGNLFGSAWGGTQNEAIFYELSPGSGSSWKFGVLYNTCNVFGCIALPQGKLLIDASGGIYGTALGGAHGDGALFKLVPNGAQSQLVDLYDFCALTNCTDGSNVSPGLAMDSAGNLYGTAKTGGTNTTDLSGVGGGTVFVFGNGTLRTLYDFCAKSKCADGEYPQINVTPDGRGNLFGITSNGGKSARGTVFELSAAPRN